MPDLTARVRETTPSLDRYRLDPFAHLDDGHVLILGLARDAAPDEEVTLGDGGVRLAAQVFTPYDYEREIAAAWIDLDRLRDHGELAWQNAIGEKSRQMGWTWTTSWLLLWALAYWPESHGLATHLNAAKVDDGGSRSTTESIFGRIRYMAESKIPRSWNADRESTWPEGMQPIDVLDFKQSPESIIVNRLSGASLNGGAATEDPGRGGSYTHILADEFARIPWGAAAHRSMRSACPTGRNYGSTPNGKSNRYYELASKPPRGYRKVRLHWTRHPIYGAGHHIAGELQGCVRCDGVRAEIVWDAEETAHLTHRYPGRVTSPWYDSAIVDLTDEDVAQELDISYEGSITARVFPQFSSDKHVIPEIRYDPALPIELSFDYGWSPSFTAVGIWQDALDSLRKIGEVEVSEKRPDEVAALIRDALADLGVPLLSIEPRFTRELLAVGDPSGEAKSLISGASIVEEYALQGFVIVSEYPDNPQRAIRSYQRLLLGRPKPVRYSAAGCPKTILHLAENRWETDRAGALKQPPKLRNDVHNHMSRADSYYVTWKFPAPAVDETLGATAEAFGDDGALYRQITPEEYDRLRDDGGRLNPEVGPGMRL